MEKVLFWIAVVITLYFIGFYKSLRNKRTFNSAMIIAAVFILVGIWGVVYDKYLIDGRSVFFFLFWLPSFVMVFRIFRNYFFKQDGIEPIISYMSGYYHRKTRTTDILFGIFVLVLPSLIVICLSLFIG